MIPLKNNKETPIIIGIAGRSCSGKSRVTRKLEEYHEDILRINLDKFFKVKADNWECPDALMFDELLRSLKRLKKGKSTHIPFHGSTEVFDRKIHPHKIIIVEGFLLFTDKRISEMFDKKIFLDVSDVNLLSRRTQREGNSKNIDYAMDIVLPNSRKYEKVQRDKADVIIDGNNSKEDVFKEIKDYIKLITTPQ